MTADVSKLGPAALRRLKKKRQKGTTLHQSYCIPYIIFLEAQQAKDVKVEKNKSTKAELPENVSIEYVHAPVLPIESPEFANVISRFTINEEDDDMEENVEAEQNQDDQNSDNDSFDEDDNSGLSKKKLKKISRLTVAQLKQVAMRPEVVEWEDVTGKDPVLLVQLKSVRNSVPVPGHWSRKRKYLAGKRGFVKPPFELPQFIKDTGIMELRQSALDEDSTKRQKTKAREKMHPRLGRITVDYEKLHNAFFRYQTKPLLTGHGDLYYEGKEFEGRSRDVRPGFLSEELRTALGMGHLMPPPWIHNIQKYGAPPSYPHMRIPGFNAPIPEGAQWGFHPGGWGKPPVDTFVSPAAVTGRPDAAKMRLLLAPVEANIWGELEPDAEDESYFVDPDQQQEMSHQVQEMTLDEIQAESFSHDQHGQGKDDYTPAAFETAGPETINTRRRR